jgi:hypothetical protein
LSAARAARGLYRDALGGGVEIARQIGWVGIAPKVTFLERSL